MVGLLFVCLYLFGGVTTSIIVSIVLAKCCFFSCNSQFTSPVFVFFLFLFFLA